MKMCHYLDLGRSFPLVVQCGNFASNNLVEAKMLHDQALPRSGWWHVIRMEFLCFFLRCCFPGKTVVAFQNVGCFLRLRTLQGPNSNTFSDTCTYCFDFSFQFFNLLVNLLLIFHCIWFIMVHLTRAMNSFSTTSYHKFNIVAVC